jgi:serine/threonine protein phosphatase 1
MGDIHGAYKAMIQCLDRSNFDPSGDMLIQLGDVTDGYPEVFECVGELLKIPHLVPLKGNHDDWFDEFCKTDFHPYFWTMVAKER